MMTDKLKGFERNSA